MNREVKRKKRKDAKRDVKPLISLDLKDAIFRLSYITQTPVKDVCEQLVRYTINEDNIIQDLSQKFKRDVRINNTLYIGSRSIDPVAKREEGERERVSLRLVEDDYEVLTHLAYALDVRPTRVCAVLLDLGMREHKFVNGYVMRYLHGQITEGQARELREIMRYLRKINGEQHTFASILGAIVDEVSVPVTRIKEAVNEFIINHWRD